MKKMKRFVALALSVVMVLAMSVMASAAMNLDSHTFEAYRIFSGDLDSDTLSNITWGNGVKNVDLLAKLKQDNSTKTEFANCETAADVAEVLGNHQELTKDFAKIVANHLEKSNAISGTDQGITLPKAGYYLIVDITDVQDNDNANPPKHDAKNLSLLKVGAKDETVTPTLKTDKPELVKKVQDTNDSENDSTKTWQDSADYDIGDEIPYQLTATMGDISNYDTYYLEFVDTMEHLTLIPNTVTVKVGENKILVKHTDYTLDWNGTNKKMTVSINNVKSDPNVKVEKGTKVTVNYTATLDQEANIGFAGNSNTAYLKYSNNPNNAGSGETGKTPEDKNIVFTYKVVANKTDGTKPLSGAVFELFKYNVATGQYESVGLKGGTRDDQGKITVEGTMTTFEWKGLDDGKYKIVEVVTPAGYNTIKDQEFTISAEHQAEADNPELIRLTGDKVTGSTITLAEKTNETGVLQTTIVNQSGSQLPSTGGIGTTIFYIVGGILMVGAAVLLITKRRAEN